MLEQVLERIAKALEEANEINRIGERQRQFFIDRAASDGNEEPEAVKDVPEDIVDPVTPREMQEIRERTLGQEQPKHADEDERKALLARCAELGIEVKPRTFTTTLRKMVAEKEAEIAAQPAPAVQPVAPAVQPVAPAAPAVQPVAPAVQPVAPAAPVAQTVTIDDVRRDIMSDWVNDDAHMQAFSCTTQQFSVLSLEQLAPEYMAQFLSLYRQYLAQIVQGGAR